MKKYIIFLNFISIIAIYSSLGYSMADPLMECDMEDTMEQLGRSFLSGAGQPWPNGRVPYVIESSLSSSNRKMFQSAIDDFHKYTCVRFRPKGNQDKDYMTVRVWYNTSKCGTAVLCYYKNKGAHYARVADKCQHKGIYMHEMLHILCLGHEQSRRDRNDFLSYEGCNNASQIAPVPSRQHLRGQIYDYNSIMHYGCYGKCSGKPKMSPDKVKKCGMDVTGWSKAGLSVLDIEKINEYYECYYGCKRHRWYNVNNLTQSHMRHVVNFASRDGDDEPVYLCRGYTLGEISVGLFRPKQNMCLIGKLGTTYNVTEHIQVFALPRGSNKITRDSKPYRLYSNADNSTISKYLALGRDVKNRDIFAATGGITLANGRLMTVVGNVASYQLGAAITPGLATMGIYVLEVFDFIGCTEN